MSDIIKLLPDAIANQIAAGEVVQRPASVVKELMENAVDAGSTRIQVIIKEAGKQLIHVIDNGKGMSATDARMCFERHATSKILKADDLFAIRTKGFRGEAMASIAAVAQVELKTRRPEDELGTSICIEGSEVKEQEPVAHPEGTSIAVKNLFFNVPARRNFLKSNAVEMRHIIDEFQRIALAHPDISFSLFQNDLETFQLSPGKLSQRIVQLFNKSYKEQMASCREDTPHVSIQGYIGKPEFAKKTRGEQFFFVNNRFIKNHYLHHAVMNAYQDLLPSDTYPFYVLFIEIDPKNIDINVHPTKTEIKFADERTVYAIVQSSVRQAIGTHNLTPSIDFEQDVNFQAFITSGGPSPSGQNPGQGSNSREWEQFRSSAAGQSSGGQPSREGNKLSNWEKLFEAEGAGKSQPEQSKMNFPASGDRESIIQPSKGFGQSLTFESAANQLGQAGAKADAGHQAMADADGNAFQMHQRYIISQVKSGMMLIDQQAAHERILYEKYIHHLERKNGASQQFLFPQKVELSPSDFALVSELMEEIRDIGFDVAPFGQQCVVINGVPADLAGTDEKHLFEGLIEQFKHNKSALTLDKRENMARSLACRSAIKKGQKLSSLEMRALIDQLFACRNPNYAPDGRPTFCILELEKLANFFNK
jgi:DNA mismatch repair protein MutL